MAHTRKPTAAGLLWALLIGIISFFVFPLYVSPVGYLWLIALMWLYAAYGPASAIACLSLMLGGVALSFGLEPMLAVTAISCVTMGVGIRALRPHNTLPRVIMHVFVALTACISIMIGVFQAFNGDLVSRITDYVRELYQAYPEQGAYALEAMGELWQTTFTTDEMLLALETTLRQTMPAQVLCYGLYGAVFAMLAAYYTLRRIGYADEFVKPFALTQWSLPKYTSRSMLGLLLVCFLLGNAGVYVAEAMLNAVWSLFFALLCLQGIATLWAVTKMRGTKKWLRLSLAIALFMFLRQALFLFGVLDRLIPLRAMARESALRARGQKQTPGASDEHTFHEKLSFPTTDDLLSMMKDNDEADSEGENGPNKDRDGDDDSDEP